MMRQSKVTKEKLFEELKKLANELNKIPSRAEFHSATKLGKTAESRFATWGAFVDASGLAALFKPVEQEKKRIEDELHVSSLKQRYNQLAKQISLEDRLVEIAKQLIPAIPMPKELAKIMPSPPGSDQVEMCTIWSDWHAGEFVDAGEMHGLNEYNYEIFVKRFQYLIEKTIDFKQHELQRTVNKLNIFFIGDIISGALHDLMEVAETGMTLMWQTFGTALIVAQGINDLLKHFPEIELYCSPGNHGRQSKKPPTNRKVTNNFDSYCYLTLGLMLKEHIKSGRIKMTIPKSFFGIANIMGHKILYTHGDTTNMVKHLPVLALERDYLQVHKIMSSKNENFEAIVMGHFHQPLHSERNFRIFINGSMTGGDAFSLVALHAATDASQLLFGISKKHGITWQWPVRLSGVEKDMKIRYKYNPDKIELAEQLIEQEEIFKLKRKK